MITAFYVLLVVGIGLICVEVFVPGVVLGSIGAVCLIGAIVLAFVNFGPQTAVLITVGMAVLLGVILMLWLKLFPKSRIGKAMTLQTDGHDFKASDSALSKLIGKSGEALSELRPGGIAIIDGQRTDVITEGEMLAKGTKVKVVAVTGNRVIVHKST